MAAIQFASRTAHTVGHVTVFMLAALRPLVHGVLRLIAVATLILVAWLCAFRSPPAMWIVGMIVWAFGAMMLSWAYGCIVDAISMRWHLSGKRPSSLNV